MKTKEKIFVLESTDYSQDGGVFWCFEAAARTPETLLQIVAKKAPRINMVEVFPGDTWEDGTRFLVHCWWADNFCWRILEKDLLA